MTADSTTDSVNTKTASAARHTESSLELLNSIPSLVPTFSGAVVMVVVATLVVVVLMVLLQ